LPSGSMINTNFFGKICGFVRSFIRFNFTTWTLLLFQTVFFIVEISNQFLHPLDRKISFQFDLKGILLLALSYVSIVLIVQLVNLLVYKKRAISFAINFLFLMIYLFLFMYCSKNKTNFDFAVLLDNYKEIFYREAFHEIVSEMSAVFFIPVISLLVALILLEKKYFLVTKWGGRKRGTLRFFATLFLYSAILFSKQYAYDPFMYFLQTAVVYPRARLKGVQVDPGVKYPYLKNENQLSGIFPSQERPHVFIILLESFNARFVNQTAPNGLEYTPIFNSLIKKGVYAEKFYSNSIQTAKGQFAVLSSIVPTMKGKEFLKFLHVDLYCLPQMLKDNGYITLFFNAGRSNAFDDTEAFMKKNGFPVCKCMNREFITHKDQKYIWGMGLQDDIFYRKVFLYLDSLNRKTVRPSQRNRFFVLLSTISNHRLFNDMPDSLKFIYPKPANPGERCSNSIRLADRFLNEFFVQMERRPFFRNSVVVLLGDHGYPMGEHQNYHNEVGYYEESFRTPLLILWKDCLKPQRIRNVCYSQIDVAPTVMDMLNIRTANHFFGVSLFDPNRRDSRMVYLVQPYDGIYLSTIIYPMKYILHLRTNREFLFNVETDPHEDYNLIEEYINTEMLKRLKSGVSDIQMNQRLIEENRIWPDR
jgi:hypothetical protein